MTTAENVLRAVAAWGLATSLVRASGSSSRVATTPTKSCKVFPGDWDRDHVANAVVPTGR